MKLPTFPRYQRKAQCIRLRKSTRVKGFDRQNFVTVMFFTPTPQKNDEKYKNYMFQFLSEQQTIEIVQIMTPVVLHVMGRRKLSSFGNRKSVFVVRNYKKWEFSEIFDFSKILRSNDNAKDILQ